MKYFPKISFIILFIFFYAGKAYSEDKIAYINLEKVLQDSNYGKKIIEQLNTVNLSNLDSLKKIEGNLSSQEDEIKKKQNIISKDEYSKELNKLKLNIKKYRDQKNLMVSEFNKLKKDQLDIFFNKINPYVQKYMDNNSISILLDSKKIYIGSSEKDVTKDIIDLINNKLK